MSQPFAIPILFLLCMSADVHAQDTARARFINEGVAAERSFRADVARLGIRDGFLAHLADDGILFRPNAVNGPAFLRAQESADGLLEWEPMYADASHAGDLVFTMGPWTIREGAEDTVLASGYYATVWRRDGSGQLKVAIDHGLRISTQHPVPVPQAVETPAIPPPLAGTDHAEVDAAGHVTVRTDIKSLLQFERELGEKSSGPDGAALLLKYTRYDAWFLRKRESAPLKGVGAIQAYGVRDPARLRTAPTAAYVARSGDLGYTYGAFELARLDGSPVENGNYLRLWRKGIDGWKIQFEVLAPVPPPPPAPVPEKR